VSDQQTLRRAHVALQIGGHEPGGARGDQHIRRRVLTGLGQHALLELQLLGNVLLDEIDLPRHGTQIGGE
jgi:hypothetical protein